MWGRECWLVSEPGELSLRKLLENRCGCEQTHTEAEAAPLETRRNSVYAHVRKLLFIDGSGGK